MALQECWAHSDALILCVRHFGCIACAQQIGELRERLADCDALSVSVTIIGCAEYQQINQWIEREQIQSLSMQVLTDPTLAVHRALGLHHGVWRTWGAKAAVNFLRAFAKGYRQRGFHGEVSQQAGALMVDQTGTLWALHKSEHLGDLPSLPDLIEAAMSARLARETLRL